MRRPLPTLTPAPPLDCPPRGQDGRTQPELVAAIVPRVLDHIRARVIERRVRERDLGRLCANCDNPAAPHDSHCAVCRREVDRLYGREVIG